MPTFVNPQKEKKWRKMEKGLCFSDFSALEAVFYLGEIGFVGGGLVEDRVVSLGIFFGLVGFALFSNALL